MITKQGFKITESKGIHITFKNGVNVSIQFGYGNYCEHRNNIELRDTKPHNLYSRTAELLIWDSEGENITNHRHGYKRDADVCKGWLSPEEVLGWLNWAKEYKR